MLDRGEDQDWFSSREIITEAVLASLGFYLFLIHIAYAREPLIRPELFKDINFSSGLVLMFMVGTLMVSSLALMTPWLQVLSNYPVETAGLMMAPRGIGSLVTTMIGGRLSGEVDARLLVGSGLLMLSLHVLADDRLDARRVGARDHRHGRDPGRRDGPGVHPAPGTGLRHIGAHDADRGRVAVQPAANIGAAIGVSVFSSALAHNSQAMHEMIGASVTPFNRALQALEPPHHWLDPATRHGAALLDRVVNQQAQIVAYADDYVLSDHDNLAGAVAAVADAHATKGDQPGRVIIASSGQTATSRIISSPCILFGAVASFSSRNITSASSRDARRASASTGRSYNRTDGVADMIMIPVREPVDYVGRAAEPLQRAVEQAKENCPQPP